MTDAPNEPHVLAGKNYAVGGVRMTAMDQVQPSHVDVGWDKDVDKMQHSIIEGIENEDVWVLIRRFDNVVFHVEETKNIHPGGLDLTTATEQEFSPNKFRSQLERLYMGAIINTISFLKHISRLRSWRESHRTGAFCFIYFLAWAIDLLGATLTITILFLIYLPPAREMLFPPHPIALVSTLSGTLTTPNAGILGTGDSLTGAPENTRGSAVENEASNFVTALGAIAMNIVMGPDPQGEPNTAEDSVDAPMPSANKLATMVATAKDKAKGVDRPSQDKTKTPMETIMWSAVPPSMRVMTVVNDYWEKGGNLLVPKAGLDTDGQRLKVVGGLAPLAVVMLFVSRDFIIRACTLFAGVVFFGDPLLRRAHTYLNANYPTWRTTLDINSSILYHIPTDPQLALSLLRLSESRHTPFPPPPIINSPPPKSPLELTPSTLSSTLGDSPLGVTPLELTTATQEDTTKLSSAGGEDVEVSGAGSTKRHRLLDLVKGAAKVGVKTTVAADKVRAKAGNPGAKNRVGALPGKEADAVAGPREFDARYEGKKGYLCIDTDAVVPVLSFVESKSKPRHEDGDGAIDLEHAANTFLWSIPIRDIVGLRKHSGYGFKSKLAAGWAIEKEVNDSLGITGRSGEEWAVTAIPKRDWLFNRLVAIGGKKWEIW